MSRAVWLASFVGWTIVGVFNIAPPVVTSLFAGRPLPKLFMALISESVLVWALYTPLILWLCLRQPLARRGRAIAVHAACAVGLAFLDPLIDTPYVLWVEPRPEPYAQRFAEELFINLFSYVAVAGIGYALAYRRGLAEQRAHDAELESQLLRARLDALTSRLQPHFLFNSLHSVAALIRTGERSAAVRAVVVLGDLLRGTLASDGVSMVPLAREAAWIRRYLEIEQMRFADRLETCLSIPPELEAALVPALLLQPLIENAIRHGVEARVGASRVEVIARREADALWLEVTDSGEASASAEVDRAREGIGLGLRATRERLAHLFGAAHRFDLEVQAGRSRAVIRIPFQAGGAS